MQGWWISYRTYGRPIHSGAVAGPHIGYLRAAKAVLDDHDETPELLQQHPSVHLHWQTKHSECTLERMSTKKTKPLSNLLFGTKRGPQGGQGWGWGAGGEEAVHVAFLYSEKLWVLCLS